MTGPGQAALAILGMAAALGLSIALAWWRGVVVAREREIEALKAKRADAYVTALVLVLEIAKVKGQKP